MEVMLKSKIARETLKTKDYDLKQEETGSVKIGEDLNRLLERLADDRPAAQTNDKDEPEVSIVRRDEAAYGGDSLKEKQLDGKDVMQSLVEKIPEEILRRTMVRKKRVIFNEGAEHLDWVKSPGSGLHQKKMLKKRNWPGSQMNGMKTQRRAAMIRIFNA